MRFLRNIITLVGIGIGLLAATVVSANDRVEYVGQSGKVTLFSPDNSGRYIRMSLDKLEEVDSHFDPIGWSTPSLASQTFTWSQPQQVIIGGNNATEVVLTTTQKVGGNGVHAPRVNFDLITDIASVDTVVNSGNQTVLVPKNTLKWSVNINDWPWKSQSNYLKFGINLKFQKSDDSDYHEDTEENDSSQIVLLGNYRNKRNGSKLIFPQNCQLNIIPTGLSDNIDVPIHYRVFWNGGIFNINFYFPYFNKTFEYDPVMSFGSDPGSTNSAFLPSFNLLPLVFLALFAF